MRQFRQFEFDEFVAEQAELPEGLQEELDAASKAVEIAISAVRLLEEESLEELRLAEAAPSEGCREAVEACAVILGVKPSFQDAQARLMPKEGAFRERLLGFEQAAVVPAAPVTA